ncbi:hypothetical protein GEV33_005428 [Tenebrio molitor]|uniref:Uncharacterized protein n=1 Tax=Tenebrio molitor TaxID=7067 RepID=A0A8J6HNB2_TENMO|nr:hypothetical protein GEV33_005428 [Tenebrio molitor]
MRPRKRKLDVQNGFPCKKLLPEKKSDVASMPTENSARVPGAAGGTGETTIFQETTKKDFDPNAIRYCKKCFFHSSPVDLRRRSRYSSSTIGAKYHKKKNHDWYKLVHRTMLHT